MKVIFAGPSIYGVSLDFAGLELRPPARHGDVMQAVRDGASAIGLIDGVFGQQRSVWHKEILFALSQGVRVLGSSSMGALRAAECAAFGMEPIGWVANAYLSGELEDDAAVAMLLGPAELGFMPLTVPLVDVLHTLQWHLASGSITLEEAAQLRTTASKLFFWDLTFDQIVECAPIATTRKAAVTKLLSEDIRSVKADDAQRLLAAIRLPAPRTTPPQWQLEHSPFWDDFVSAPTPITLG